MSVIKKILITVIKQIQIAQIDKHLLHFSMKKNHEKHARFNSTSTQKNCQIHFSKDGKSHRFVNQLTPTNLQLPFNQNNYPASIKYCNHMKTNMQTFNIQPNINHYNNKVSYYAQSVNTPLKTFEDPFADDFVTQNQSQNLVKTELITNLRELEKKNPANKYMNNYQKIPETKMIQKSRQYYSKQIGYLTTTYKNNPINTDSLKQTICKQKNEIMSRNKQINKELNLLRLKNNKYKYSGENRNIEKDFTERINEEHIKYYSPKYTYMKYNDKSQKKYQIEDLEFKIEYLTRNQKRYKEKLDQDAQKINQLEKEKYYLINELQEKYYSQNCCCYLKKNQEGFEHHQQSTIIQQNNQLKEKVVQLEQKDQSNIYLIQFLNKKSKQAQDIFQTKLNNFVHQYEIIKQKLKSTQQKLFLQQKNTPNYKQENKNTNQNVINIENANRLKIQQLTKKLESQQKKIQQYEIDKLKQSSSKFHKNKEQREQQLKKNEVDQKINMIQNNINVNNNELQLTNKILVRENEVLKQSLINFENFQSNLDNLIKSQEIHQLLTEITNLKNEFTKTIVQNKNNNNNSIVLELQHQLQKQKQQYKQLKTKYIQQQQQHKQIQIKVYQFKDLIKQFEIEKERNQSQQKQLIQLKQVLQKCQKSEERLKNQIESKQYQIIEKQKEIQRKNNDLQLLRDNYHTLELQLTKINTKSKQLKNTLIQRENQLEQQTNKFTQLKQNLEIQMKTKFQKQEEELKNKNTSLIKQIQNLKNIIQQSNTSHKKELKELNQNKNINQQILTQKCHNYQHLNKELKQQIEFKEYCLTQKEAIIIQLKEQLNKKQNTHKAQIDYQLKHKSNNHHEIQLQQSTSKVSQLEENIIRYRSQKARQSYNQFDQYKLHNKHHEIGYSEASDSHLKISNYEPDNLQRSSMMSKEIISDQGVEAKLCNQLLMLLKKWNKSNHFQADGQYQFSDLIKYIEQRFAYQEHIIQSQEEQINRMIMKFEQNASIFNNELLSIMVQSKLVNKNKKMQKKYTQNLNVDTFEDDQEEKKKYVYTKKRSLVELCHNYEEESLETHPKVLQILKTRLHEIENKIEEILNIFMNIPKQKINGYNQHTLHEILQIIQKQIHDSEVKEIQDKVENFSSKAHLNQIIKNEQNKNQKDDQLVVSQDQLEQIDEVDSQQQQIKISVNNTTIFKKYSMNEKKPSQEDLNGLSELSRSNSISFKFEVAPSNIKNLSEKIESRNIFQEGNRTMISKFFDFENHKLAKELFTFFNYLYEYPNHQELFGFQEAFLQDLKNIQVIQEQRNALLKVTCQKYFELMESCFTSSQQEDQDQQDTYLLQEFKPIQNYSEFEVASLNLLTRNVIPEKLQKNQKQNQLVPNQNNIEQTAKKRYINQSEYSSLSSIL